MEEDICNKCGRKPYIHYCIHKTKKIMTECEHFEEKMDSGK